MTNFNLTIGRQQSFGSNLAPVFLLSYFEIRKSRYKKKKMDMSPNHQISVVSVDRKISRDLLPKSQRRLRQCDTRMDGQHFEGHKQIVAHRAIRTSRRLFGRP